MAIELDPLAGAAGGDESRRLAKHWLDQINTIKDDTVHKRWIKRGEDIEKRYRDERTHSEGSGQRRYNALWSNVEVLRPAIYGKMPLPVAERRFKDKDPTGRGAAQILERALRNEIEICGYDRAIQQAVQDFLLPGRGTVWVRYEPEIEEGISLPIDPQTDMRDSQGPIGGKDIEGEIIPPKRLRLKLDRPDDGQETPGGEGGIRAPSPDDQEEVTEKLASTGDRVIRESTPVDFIPWTDFFSFPVRARTWREVTAVAKRVYMSRDQLLKRFGPIVGKKIPLQKDDRGQKSQNTALMSDDEDKAQVYEIWARDDSTVYWVAQGYDHLCDRKDDPLKLENFYPCPEPIYANSTNNTLVPVPDYIQYQDQAIQIDELTQRISILAKACKVAGVYNAAATGIRRLMEEGVENELIPVDDWTAFAEKGGVEGNISLLPVKDIIGIINELMMVKQKQIEELDRLTGITDVLRGTSDARETLGGVRLKTNSAGTRLTRRQNEVARFARDTLRIMADIMATQFSPQSLIDASGALYEEGLGPDDMPSLNTLQSPPPPTPAPPQPAMLPPMGAPGAQQAPPIAQAPPMGGLVPGAPPLAPPSMGSNVVPFRPPPPPMPGMPPGGPAGPMGVVPPPMPPELLAKVAALKRIAGALKLLRNERLRGFRVDIEVDSTIFPDAAQEKADRTQFIATTTQYLQTSMQMGAAMPEMIPLLGKLLQFGVRGHRVGRDLEVAIEEFCDQAEGIAKQKAAQASQQPNPEMIKAQTELATAKIEQQVAQLQGQVDMMQAQAKLKETQIKAQSEEASAAAEVQRQQAENQGEQANAMVDAQVEEIEREMRVLEMRLEVARMDREEKLEKMRGKQAEKLAEHEAEMADKDMALSKQEHKNKLADAKKAAAKPAAK